jgi:preprotein translocase SecE subunit
MSFLKKSLEELDHVVWPTNAESKKYMIYTVGTIIVMATLLSAVGYVIQLGLKSVRDIFPHDTVVSSTVSGEESVTEADIEKLKLEAERRRNALSGASIEVNSTPPTENVVTPPPVSGTGN